MAMTGFQTIPPGERLVIMTPGVGEPQKRDPAAVSADLEAGLVSPKAAQEVHGLPAEAAE